MSSFIELISRRPRCLWQGDVSAGLNSRQPIGEQLHPCHSVQTRCGESYAKQENVSVEVDGPGKGKSGLALCPVTVKPGDETVWKSKLQMVVVEP